MKMDSSPIGNCGKNLLLSHNKSNVNNQRSSLFNAKLIHPLMISIIAQKIKQRPLGYQFW